LIKFFVSKVWEAVVSWFQQEGPSQHDQRGGEFSLRIMNKKRSFNQTIIPTENITDLLPKNSNRINSKKVQKVVYNEI